VDFHGRVIKGMAKSIAKELEAIETYVLRRFVLPRKREAFSEMHAM